MKELRAKLIHWLRTHGPRRLRRYAGATVRWGGYLSAALFVLLAILLIAVWVLLPRVAERKTDIEAYLSRAAGQKIRIEKLAPHWDGIHPGLRADGVNVFSAAGARPAVRLDEVRLSVALLPLFWGEAQINRLVVVHPRLALERLNDGSFRIFGLSGVQPEGDGVFLNWLLRQGWLVIEDGELLWLDQRDPAVSVPLARVNLSLRNDGNRHRLSLQAQFPVAMCRECSISADIRGNPVQSDDWKGDIDVHARDLDVAALPRIVRELFPPDFRAHVSTTLATKWTDGRPSAVRGPLDLSGLNVPAPGLASPLAIQALRGDVNWAARGDGWRLDVAGTQIGLRNRAWSAGPVRVQYGTSESAVDVGHVDLADVTAFVASLAIVPADRASWDAWREPWLSLSPGGALDRAHLEVTGALGAPGDFTLEANLTDVATQVYRGYPGFDGVSGQLHLSRSDGEFRLASDNLRLNYPQLFRAAFPPSQAQGRIAWENRGEYWQVESKDFSIVNEDVRATGTLGLKIPTEGSPTIDLRADFREANGAHATRYFPAKILSPGMIAWMDRSFVSGHVTSAQFVYSGRTSDFPFLHDNGRFEIRAHVTNGVYRYLPGWEPIRDADVDVAILNNDVIITGGGRVGGLKLQQTMVQTEIEHFGKEPVVRVSGRFSGPVSETLAVLRGVKPAPGEGVWQGYLPSGLQASGDGVLGLSLNIPLDGRPTEILGEYQVTGAGLALPALGVRAEAVRGRVEFTEAGARAGELRGRLFGGDTVFSIATPAPGDTQYHVAGRVTATGLAPVVGSRFAARLSGYAPWEANWTAASGLQAELDLRALRATLPAPLNRPDGLLPVVLTAHSESTAAPRRVNPGLRAGAVSPPRSHAIVIGPAGGISGRIAFARAPAGWRFYGGRIAFGNGGPVAPWYGRGLYASARIGELDVDAWLKYLASGTATDTGGKPVRSAGTADLPSWLARVSADIQSLDTLNRRFGHVAVDLAHNGIGWSGTLNGDSFAGRVTARATPAPGRVELDLARLNVPASKAQSTGPETDPRRLPALTLKAKTFRLKGNDLGELDFAADHVDAGWHIVRLNLTRPEAKLAVSGNWLAAGTGSAASDMAGKLTTTDMGKTLDAIGFPGQMSGGEVELTSNLSWPGGPASMHVANLVGKIDVQAKKGRFLQVKQGAAGRLFGLLDLSSITRYLTLDFSPIFGKGLIFDEIRGTVTLDRGDAVTHNLLIRPPAAHVAVNGRVGLVAEDYDLTIEVEPRLSDTLTLASWGIWGPQVAAVVLAVQRIFKEEINRGSRVTYMVRGPWANPVVTKTQTGKAPPSGVAPPK